MFPRLFSRLAFAATFSIGMLLSGASFAFYGAPGTQVMVAKGTGGATLGYHEYLPSEYSETSGQKFPIVFYFHGAGGKGSGLTDGNLQKLLKEGVPKMLASGKQLPAIAISPQSSGWWSGKTANTFIDFIMKKYPAADLDRIYLTGGSMGGDGTWLTAYYPTNPTAKFAAIVPICGAASLSKVTPDMTNRLANIPVWAFHSYDDTLVNPLITVNMVNRISPVAGDDAHLDYTKSIGDQTMVFSRSSLSHKWFQGASTDEVSLDTRLRMTLYQSGGHDMFDRVYNDPNMWNWLFKFKRNAQLIGEAVPASEEPVDVTRVSFPDPARTMTVDFGVGGADVPGFNDGNLAHKNGILALKDGLNNPTGASLVKVTNPGKTNRTGTLLADTSVDLPPFMTADTFYSNNAIPVIRFELQGLDPSKDYSFEFFASRMGTTTNLDTLYSVSNGVDTISATLNPAMNISKKAIPVSGIKPDASGKLTIDVKKGPANKASDGIFYLGSMVVHY